MCNQRRTVSSDGGQKAAYDEQEREINCLRVSAEELYESCLKNVKSKFQEEGKAIFYQSFENAYRQIYYEARKNKKRYWNRTSIFLLVLGTGGSGTAAAVSLFSFVRILFSVSAESDMLPDIALSYAPLLLSLCLALGFLMACLFTEFKRRNYKDTWIRHSVAYHRLNITMIRYLSDLISEEEFMKEVLHILETDVERFEQNASDSQGRKA